MWPSLKKRISPRRNCTVRLRGAVGWHSVFAGTKEEKERNGKEIRDGLSLRGRVSTIVSDDALDGPDGERQLWFRSGIRCFIRF